MKSPIFWTASSKNRDDGSGTLAVTRRDRFRQRHFLHVLAGIFVAYWALMAITPVDRRDWLLENAIVFPLFLVLALTYRKWPLSNLSYVLIAIYVALHEVGAHYGYDDVPFGYWLKDTFHLHRNPYDRIVHFCFGLLMTYPFRDAFLLTSETTGFWSYFFPANIVMSLSAIYEIIEAFVAMTAHPGLATAFLGMQGDPWDSQRDMLMALIGAVTCSLIAFVINQIKLRRKRGGRHPPARGRPANRTP
jgi:putative membrane protein